MKSPSTQLREQIERQFSLDELRTLCFDLEVDFDNLPGGDTKTPKVRELIKYMQRRGRLPDLIEELRKKRPHIDWPARHDSSHADPESIIKPTLEPGNRGQQHANDETPSEISTIQSSDKEKSTTEESPVKPSKPDIPQDDPQCADQESATERAVELRKRSQQQEEESAEPSTKPWRVIAIVVIVFVMFGVLFFVIQTILSFISSPSVTINSHNNEDVSIVQKRSPVNIEISAPTGTFGVSFRTLTAGTGHRTT